MKFQTIEKENYIVLSEAEATELAKAIDGNAAKHTEWIRKCEKLIADKKAAFASVVNEGPEGVPGTKTFFTVGK